LAIVGLLMGAGQPGLVLAQGPSAAEVDDATRLDQIVVTAQKREQAIEDVPIAMTVVDRSTIEKTRGKTLADLQQILPNFQFERGGFNSLAIRGVGGGGRNIGFDTRAGMYLDGVYVGQAQSLGMPLFDIEQVEVLRGPQGHLFGRNTVSGAVNITTTPPSSTPQGSIRGIYGNHDAFEVYASASGPLSDRVLGKIAAGYETRDGFTRNLFDGNDLDNLDRFSTRGQLSFLVSDKLTIDVFGDYSDTEEDAIVGEPITDFFDTPFEANPFTAGPFDKRQVAFDTTPFTNATLYGGSVTITYDMDNGHTLTGITGYRNIEHRRQNDTDYNPFDILTIKFNEDFEQISQEIRFASPDDGRLRYVAGVYFVNEDADSERFANVGSDLGQIIPLPVGAPVPFAPAGLAFGLTPGSVVPAIANIETDNIAVFGSLDFDITDRLTLNLGARFTHEEKDIVFNLDGSQSGGFRIGTLDNFRDDRTDNEFNPTVGLTFALTEQANLYAKYANGFKSGGWNIDFLNVAQVATGFDFDTETVDSYEIGIKGATADGRLRYDLAGFYNQFDDFQIFQFVALGGGTSILQLRNAAKVETIGGEASVSFQVSENLRLNANLGYVDAEFDKFPDGGAGGADLSGNELSAPDWTGAFSFDYSMPTPALSGRLDLYGEYSYRGGFFSGADNDPTFQRIDSRNLVNARLTYSHDGGRFAVSGWARNLFDEDFLQNRGRDFLGNQFVLRGEPRSYGVELSFAF
jgi:iron complex outermembrane receptor protein